MPPGMRAFAIHALPMHRIVPRRGGSRVGAAALVLRLGRKVDHFPVLVIPMRPADRIARFVEKESEFRARAERMRPPWVIPLNAWLKCRSDGRASCRERVFQTG